MEIALLGPGPSLAAAIFATGVLIETILIRSKPVREKKKTAGLLNNVFVAGLLVLLVSIFANAGVLAGVVAVVVGLVGWRVGVLIVRRWN